MELNIVNEVAALQRLSVGQLRQRFAELFGETTHARNDSRAHRLTASGATIRRSV